MNEARYNGDDRLTRYGEYGATSCRTIPYCTGSDYSGDSVTKSNFYLLKNLFSRYRGFYTCYGMCGTYSIAYIESELTRKGKILLDDIIYRLAHYPSLDDTYLLEFERNLINEYIDSEYKYMDIDIPIEIVKKVVHANSLAIIESGCNVYIDEDRLKSILMGGI